MLSYLYVVRAGENEELRYSLRSLKNAPPGNVVIAGGAPRWLNTEAVTFVPVEQAPVTRHEGWWIKYQNVRLNLAAGLQKCNETVVLMNDDMFFTGRVDKIEALRWPSLNDLFAAFSCTRERPTSTYMEGEVATLSWCESQGVSEPHSYALHVPMPLERDKALDLLSLLPSEGRHPIHFRTAYGNYWGIGGKPSLDVKVTNQNRSGVRRLNGKIISPPAVKELPVPLASTSDRSFTSFEVGSKLRSLFPEPSGYEL